MTLEDEAIPVITLFVFLFAATLADAYRRRIPNMLTISGALIGMGCQYWRHGGDGLISGLSGLCTGLFLFFPFFAAGLMGAGDVKMMAAVGAFLGWPDSLLAAGLTLGLGAVLALVLLAVRGGLMAYLRRYGIMAQTLLVTGQFTYIPPQAGDPAARRFPYAFAIDAGALAALWLGGSLDVFLNVFKVASHG